MKILKITLLLSLAFLSSCVSVPAVSAATSVRVIDRGDFFLGLYATPTITTKELAHKYILESDSVTTRGKAEGSYQSPLNLANTIFRLLLVSKSNQDETLKQVALSGLDSLLLEFEKNGYWQRPAWPPLEAGWWSGMDFAAVSLALQAAYEITGDQQWAAKRARVADGMFRMIKDKGVLLKIGTKSEELNKCWYLEYVWDGVNEDNAFFVQNGALFTLQAIKLLADATGNPEYQEYFDCGVRGFAHYSDKFYFDNREWSYYMLNPKTIIEPHYMIVEILLLDSLYKLSGESVFSRAAEQRRAILKSKYPIFVSEDVGGEKEYVFARIGSPHPYYIDVLNNELFFFDSRNRVVGYNQTVEQCGIQDNIKNGSAFLRGKIPSSAIRYQVFALSGRTLRTLLHEGFLEPLDLRTFKRQPTPVSYSISAFGDGKVSQNGEIVISPFFDADPIHPSSYLNNRASIAIDFKHPVNRLKTPFVGIRLFSEKEVAIHLVAMDATGRVADRYFPNLKRGNNTLLLSFVGFDGIDTLSDDISTVQLDILTDPLKQKKVKKFKFAVKSAFVESDMLGIANFLKGKASDIVETY